MHKKESTSQLTGQELMDMIDDVLAHVKPRALDQKPLLGCADMARMGEALEALKGIGVARAQINRIVAGLKTSGKIPQDWTAGHEKS